MRLIVTLNLWPSASATRTDSGPVRVSRRYRVHVNRFAQRGEAAAAMILGMDATTIDQEFEQLQAEFQDVAKTVQGLEA